jgi:hypothetical protein
MKMLVAIVEMLEFFVGICDCSDNIPTCLVEYESECFSKLGLVWNLSLLWLE